MATIERKNMVGMKRVAALLSQDLIDNGFNALAVNQSTSSLSIDADNFEDCLLAPTKSVDALALEETDTSDANFDKRQPWRLIVEASDTDGCISIYACTPTNVKVDQSGTYEVATSDATLAGARRKSGLMSYGSWTQDQAAGNKFSLAPAKPVDDMRGCTFNTAFWGIDLANVDYESIPFSYRLTVSDHGIAFLMWIESRDGAGHAYGWFCIQRMVDSTGAAVIDGKAPLFALFSPNGGGGAEIDGGGTIRIADETYDALNAPDPIGILKFVVRESDVNAPTIPHSATVDTADSTRIINSVQQVATSEDETFIVNFPKGLNSQRYAYEHELDLIGFTSADVIPQWNEAKLTVYGEETERTFKAMNANHINNKGMRLLMLISGGGV